jgi:hypothetical protein
MSKSEVLYALVKFFMDEGRVFKRSEYYKLGVLQQPVHHRLLSRYFRGRGYNSILHTASKKYPTEWASIGSIPEEIKPAPQPVVEPAKEGDLSPLEKLRASVGESSE